MRRVAIRSGALAQPVDGAADDVEARDECSGRRGPADPHVIEHAIERAMERAIAHEITDHLHAALEEFLATIAELED